LEAGEAEAIIVHTADRFSRNLAHSLILRESFQRLGVELHYVDRGKAQDTAESRLTQNVEAVIAEYEREKIKERTRRGLHAKAQAGKWVGHGPEPYGYRRDGRGRDTRLVIDPVEAKRVRRIFALYTGANRHKPAPLRGIAELLNQDGIASPGRATKSGPGPGRGWYIKTLKEILTRRVYIGELGSEGETFPKPELALVDRATFDKAQTQREKNRARASRNCKHEYLLTGFLKCLCGCGMSGKATVADEKRQNLYYRCLSTVYVNSMRPCREKFIRCDVADSIVWDWLSGLFTDPDKFHRGLADYANRLSTESQTKRQQLADTKTALREAEDNVKRLARDLREIKGKAGRAAVKAEFQTASSLADRLENERDDLAAELGDDLPVSERLALMQGWAKEIREGLADGDVDYEAKRRQTAGRRACPEPDGLTSRLKRARVSEAGQRGRSAGWRRREYARGAWVTL
jgi:site-specific DNA recombinase